jgi:choline-glycine betaine transporter
MQLNAVLTALAFLLAAVFVCYSLLKNAQLQEDADDERLWDYLLEHRRPFLVSRR